jgi:hypothetical protein
MLTKSLIPFVALAALGSTAPHQKKPGQSCSNAQQSAVTVGKAVYFITNGAENSVVALPIGKDGSLSKGSVTKTGGAGSAAVDGATKEPALPDALVGQSSLTVVGTVSQKKFFNVVVAHPADDSQNLFTVNAGSNTLTMMSISASDPTCLEMKGAPVAIPGEFPNTVAASMKNNLVCVGTTGAQAGISCASFNAQGVGKMDALRKFDIGQTTPPVGPTNTVSQSFFSNDESMLFTTVKGDPAVNNTGFLSVFPVEAGRGMISKLSTKEVRSSPEGTAVLFGSAPIPDSQDLFVTDASFGAAVVKLDQAAQATVGNAQAIGGQKATCWATISEATKSAYVTDVATNRVVEMSLDDASIIAQLDLSANGDPGLVDLKSAGSFVYALSPGNGTTSAAITVLDVSGGKGSMKMSQHFDLSGLADSTAQGMAALL